MKSRNLVLLFTLIVVTSTSVLSQKIEEWRGKNRQGIYYETGLLEKWPANGPDLLWAVENIGQGYAAPVITDNFIVINGESDGKSFVFAFDKKGNLIWKSPNGGEFTGDGFSANYPGARSTPTVVDGLVYAISGKGHLGCFELSTGKTKWESDLVAKLGGFENMFGYAESPLVSGDTLFCTPGGQVNNVVALNRLTGQLLWTSKATGDTTSFCSPILINLPKAKVFVNISRHHIYGLDATNGKLLWKQHLAAFRYEGEHCNTPVYNNGFIYYTTADENGNGTVCLKISEDGKSITEIWRNKETGGAFGGMVLLENRLFLTTNGKKLVSYDVSDGKEVAALKPCKGGLIYANNQFYCNDENGQMKLIGFNGKTFEENGKFKIPKGNKEHFSHPVISDGILFIRHGKALMAYNIKL